MPLLLALRGCCRGYDTHDQLPGGVLAQHGFRASDRKEQPWRARSAPTRRGALGDGAFSELLPDSFLRDAGLSVCWQRHLTLGGFARQPVLNRGLEAGVDVL